MPISGVIDMGVNSNLLSIIAHLSSFYYLICYQKKTKIKLLIFD